MLKPPGAYPERLTTESTPAWYAGTRAKVEARAELDQAQELRRVLEELGKELRVEGQSTVTISSLNGGTRGEVQLSS